MITRVSEAETGVEIYGRKEIISENYFKVVQSTAMHILTGISIGLLTRENKNWKYFFSV